MNDIVTRVTRLLARSRENGLTNALVADAVVREVLTDMRRLSPGMYHAGADALDAAAPMGTVETSWVAIIEKYASERGITL